MSARLLQAAPDITPNDSAVAHENESTIGDVAREFGVTLRTLRFYEHRGLLQPRREGMARFYSAADKGRLALILKGKQLGFTLTQIRAMLAANERGELGMSREQMASQLETPSAPASRPASPSSRRSSRKPEAAANARKSPGPAPGLFLCANGVRRSPPLRRPREMVYM